jgi:predicted CopG family antitoxin
MRKKSFTRQVGVLFSEETYENLIQITDEIEISVSEFIRRIIEENINQWKKEGNKNELSRN